MAKKPAANDNEAKAARSHADQTRGQTLRLVAPIVESIKKLGERVAHLENPTQGPAQLLTEAHGSAQTQIEEDDEKAASKLRKELGL